MAAPQYGSQNAYFLCKLQPQLDSDSFQFSRDYVSSVRDRLIALAGGEPSANRSRLLQAC